MERDHKSEAEENSSPNWLELPREIILSILDKLDAVEIIDNVQMVCTQWESICKDPSLWRSVIFRDDETKDFDDPWHLYHICKQAVDLSCGGMIDIYITGFAGDQLLGYITQRCTQIKRLQLVRIEISGLCEAAKRLPLLEDLEIYSCYGETEKALSMLGQICPLLKSLKLNRQGERYPLMDDSEAEAIAGNMVELRHLQLFGNRLTNKGLEAILDSCTHLESLDVRQCFNINNSSLGKICGERIKDFRAPYDSTNDYEFDATIYEDEDEEDEYPDGVSFCSKWYD